MCVCVYVCMYCVYVREGETERDRGKEGKRECAPTLNFTDFHAIKLLLHNLALIVEGLPCMVEPY